MSRLSSVFHARYFRAAVIMLPLLGALVTGFAVPALASAPAQNPPTDAADLAQTVSSFLDLLIALAVGGGVAYLLQMSSKWTTWKSPFKPLVVIALTAVLGAALSAAKVFATAEVFQQAPDWARAFVGFIVVFVGSQLTYQKGFSPQWVTTMRTGIVLAVLLLGGALLLANAPVANAESPAADRLAQEPYLACVAVETGLPSDLIAIAKIKFDTKFGFQHNLTTAGQWGATYGDRVQAFTDWLGVPNPTRDGVPLKWCARLIEAQARILEP